MSAFSFSYILLILSLQTHLSLTLTIPNISTEEIAMQVEVEPIKDIHDVLTEYALPKGLIPDIVESYTLSDNGHFQINLVRPCYVQFADLVHYDRVVEGKLKNGSITGISGIQVKKLFAWLLITEINADLEADTVEFQIGFLFEKLPAKLFKDIPSCKSKACDEKSNHPEFI